MMPDSPGNYTIQEIPETIVERLPAYQRHLSELAHGEIDRISSRELAVRMGITASQIRKDLNWFGSYGLQGYGYRVRELLHLINQILGLDQKTTMVLIGGGSLGQALINYPGFQVQHFQVKAVFDDDPAVTGKFDGLMVNPLSRLLDYLEQNRIRIGVIADSKIAVQEVTNVLVKGGVQGIWNFTPVKIQVPPHITVEYVHIIESLMILSYKCNEKSNGNR